MADHWVGWNTKSPRLLFLNMELLRTPFKTVFVATGFKQKADGRLLMHELQQRQLLIACDWTVEHAGLTKAAMAVRDVDAMKRADVLVAVMTLTDYEYKGTWTEIGMALGRGIPVVLVSPFEKAEDAICARNVYFHHPSFVRVHNASTLLASIDTGLQWTA